MCIWHGSPSSLSSRISVGSEYSPVRMAFTARFVHSLQKSSDWSVLRLASKRFLISAGGNRTTGKCLDVAGGGSAIHSRLQLFRCHGNVNQQFQLHGDGTLRVMGKCLDIPDSKAIDHQGIQLFHCRAGEVNQRFFFDEENRIHVMNKCLDVPNGEVVNNNPLQLFRCHQEDSQRFLLSLL